MQWHVAVLLAIAVLCSSLSTEVVARLLCRMSMNPGDPVLLEYTYAQAVEADSFAPGVGRLGCGGCIVVPIVYRVCPVISSRLFAVCCLPTAACPIRPSRGGTSLTCASTLLSYVPTFLQSSAAAFVGVSCSRLS